MLKGKLICPCQITLCSFFGPTDVKPAPFLYSSSQEKPAGTCISHFKKTQSSVTLLLFSQFVLLKVNFKDHKITTVILIGSMSKSSGNSLYISSPHISLTLELRCCDSAWVSPSPLGTPPAPCSRNGLVTGCNPPGTGATSSYLLSIESWICKRAARHGGISPI